MFNKKHETDGQSASLGWFTPGLSAACLLAAALLPTTLTPPDLSRAVPTNLFLFAAVKSDRNHSLMNQASATRFASHSGLTGTATNDLFID